MIKQLKELSAFALVESGQFGPFKLGWNDYYEIEYAQLCYNNKKDDRFNNAVELGRLDFLIRLVKDGHTWNKWTCMYVVKRGNLEILKWLLDPNARSDGNGSKGIICPLDIEECMRCAKENNYLEIVELFKQYV